MNEHIKLLAEQAGMRECSLGYGMPENVLWGENQIENFAQLIVQKCAKEAFKYTWNRENYDHYSDVGWDCLPGNLRSHIEEHFGVEK
jgi:hypothetical protein